MTLEMEEMSLEADERAGSLLDDRSMASSCDGKDRDDERRERGGL
jgi:hypothetical protein